MQDEDDLVDPALGAAMASRRYAIYFAPTGELWRAGCAWLAGDEAARLQSDLPHLASTPSGGGQSPSDLAAGTSLLTRPSPAWTAAPRHYGFHATLKAPFRLAQGFERADLLHALRRWASTKRPFEIVLALGFMGEFLALQEPVPHRDGPMQGLAADAVRQFDCFRALPTPAERARRLAAPLSARERELFERWGYPYVLEAFRFHLTLSATLPESARGPIQALAHAHFGRFLGKPERVDGVALFEQPDPHTPFTLTERCGFAEVVELDQGPAPSEFRRESSKD